MVRSVSAAQAMDTDGDLLRMWVQGITAGRMHDVLGFEVRQEQDERGRHHPWFDMVLDGGDVVRVTFETQQSSPEPKDENR